MAVVSPLQASVHLSANSLDSLEQLEEALRGVMHTSKRSWGLTSVCRGEPITDAGKRQQLARMLSLTLLPVAVLLAVALYYMADNIVIKLDHDMVKSNVAFTVELGNMVHTLQQERDTSVLYLSSIGPETKNFLLPRYLETDSKIKLLSMWPVDINTNPGHQRFVNSKNTFLTYLNAHRSSLGISNNQTVFEEIAFYTDIINVFIKWMYPALTKSRFGATWKTLVAFQKVLASKEDAGVERALGTTFFALGKFETHAHYEWYNQKFNVFQSNFRAATNYSPLVQPIADMHIKVNNGLNLSGVINEYRRMIQMEDLTAPSVSMATGWFDIMTVYLELLHDIQEELANQITATLDARSANMIQGTVTGCVVVALSLAMLPFMVRAVTTLTNNIQSFAITLVDKTKELNREKKRTDSLLYQMLPRSVAEQLKRNSSVDAEYFKEATIFFSCVNDFDKLATILSPMHIVSTLNQLYSEFDARIGQFDVYKVETIGTTYMVASGVPKRNGKRHVTEVANMALFLLDVVCHLDLPDVPQRRVQIQIGMHSGPCVGGVVGSKLPRYCLFGDTINTASRMQSTGMPSRIHITATLARLLMRLGNYIVQERGLVDVKGKGQMKTYWLLGKDSSRAPATRPQESLQKMSESTSLTELKKISASPNHGMKACSSEDSIPIRDSRDRKSSTCKKEASGGKVKSSTSKGEDSPKPGRSNQVEADDMSLDEMQNVVAPPSYEDLERKLELCSSGSPPILQLTEGYHY